MNIAAKLKKFFSQYQCRYQVFSHARTITLKQAQQTLNIPPESFARSILLGDSQGLILAVLPLSRKLDFDLINKRLKRQLVPVEGAEVDRVFFDCEPGSHPVIGVPYGLKLVVDLELAKPNSIYFEPGTHTSVIRVSQREFRYMQSGAVWANISVDLLAKDSKSCLWSHSVEKEKRLQDFYEPKDDLITQKVEALYPLPPLPPMAHKMLEYIQQEKPCPLGFKALVETNPYLTAWFLQHATVCSDNPLSDVGEAVDKLGMEASAMVAMGASAACIFQVPKQGPLGLNAFWRHALSCAYITRQLAQESVNDHLDPRQAFLCGLMHNFGFLLFGHLFTPEFNMLNKLFCLEPQMPMEYLEKKVLGLGHANHVLKAGHARMGAWLLQSWGFSQEVVLSAKYHHTLDYTGEHFAYIHLIMLANSLLREKGVGDGQVLPLKSFPLQDLGLSANQIQQAMQCCQAHVQRKDTLMPGIARQ